jgi:hypothetical protein
LRTCFGQGDIPQNQLSLFLHLYYVKKINLQRLQFGFRRIDKKRSFLFYPTISSNDKPVLMPSRCRCSSANLR